MATIILGSVQFGIPYGINNNLGIPDIEEVITLLDFARSNGITIIDTAAAYGAAQNKIAAYHQNHPPFEIITKVHLEGHENIQQSIEASLENLYISSFHTILYHRFSDYMKFPKEHRSLMTMKKQGLMKYAGVSIYSNDEFSRAIQLDWVDVIQFPYNLLDNDAQRGALINTAKKAGKILHSRSVFLQGLLMKPIKDFPLALHPLKKYLANISQAESRHQIQRLSLCINYALQNKLLDGVLIGVDTKEQLKQNINASLTPITNALMHEIDHIKVTEIDLLYPYNWP